MRQNKIKNSVKFAAAARREAAAKEGFYDGRFAQRKYADVKSYNRNRLKFESEYKLDEWDEWDFFDF